MKLRARALSSGRGSWASVLIIVLAGCADRSAPAGTGSLIVDQADVHVVGTLDAIARIEDLMPAADGAAWVINSVEPFVILLSKGGQQLRATGRLGDGPGEYSWPTTFVRNPASQELWVYDAAIGRLTLIDEEPEAETVSLGDASSGAFRLNSYAYLWMNNGGRTWIHGTEDGFIYARPNPGLPWMGAFWSTEVTEFTPGAPPEVLISTADVVGDPRTRFGDGLRFLPYPIWAGCPDGSLAVYDPHANALRRFSATGEPTTVHELPPERRVRISTERILTTVYPDILKNRLLANPPEQSVLFDLVRRDYETRESEFSDVFPEYVHLECGPQSTLWLQRFDSTSGHMGRGPDWLRVTIRGDARSVQMPDSFRPMRFTGGRIWGVHTDELDVEHVAWTQLWSLEEQSS